MGEAAVSTKSDIELRAKQNELEQCEAVIAEHGRAFVEVGRALARIRDGGLYKGRGFKTFEAYCKEHWEMGRSRAYQLIEASSFVSDVHNCGQAPANEAQVRELLKLPEPDRAKVWEMAVETAPDGKITAKHVAKLVSDRLGGADNEDEENDFNIVVASAHLKDSIRALIAKWPSEHQSAAVHALRQLANEIDKESGTDGRTLKGLLRYPGSKDKIADKIIKRHMSAMESGSPVEYREPFFGSGSFGFRALSGLNGDSTIWLNDKDPALVSLWLAVYQNPDDLNKMIGEFEPTTDAFFRFKEQDGGVDLDPVLAGFQKFALHQISFSGIGAKAGGPIGGKKQSSEYDVGCRWNAERHIKHVNQWHRLLASFRSVRITCCDFDELIVDAPSDSFIYLDPPYYEKGGELYKHSFDNETHRRLSASLHNCDAQWVLSYDDNETIRDLYSWADISLIDLKYTVAASSSSREVKQELIIKPRRDK